MTIVEFLEARIAEDEAAARAATPGPWTLYDRGVGWEIPELPEVHDGLTFRKADAHYVARWDPARVLAECAAKRAILSHFDGTMKWARDPDCPAVQSYSDIAVGLGESIRHLVAVYSDHPDYDKDWAL